MNFRNLQWTAGAKSFLSYAKMTKYYTISSYKMSITHDFSPSQEGCGTLVAGARLYFSLTQSGASFVTIFFFTQFSFFLVFKSVSISSSINNRAVRHSHRKYVIGKQTISKFIFNLVLYFKKYLKVPKRENFSLAFFALNEPIWVCDL